MRDRPVKRRNLEDLAHICVLLLVPGLAAWLFGRPMIFPSLGPSAFALVLDEKENSARRVIGGHLPCVSPSYDAVRRPAVIFRRKTDVSPMGLDSGGEKLM